MSHESIGIGSTIAIVIIVVVVVVLMNRVRVIDTSAFRIAVHLVRHASLWFEQRRQR